ncbi:MAG: UDP-glucose--hexose-1-phosphate uridylyltransferase [Candidatus Izemoplasmatales bacterium]|nr:UDP-glucose--hexose-1-phosphate uridylyltransferase [Candidatus Izemoplasmatales bacterium]
MINTYINQLIDYGINNKLLESDDIYYAVNKILKILDLTSFKREKNEEMPVFSEIMENIIDYAIEKKVLKSSTIAAKDAFEAMIVDSLLPRPSELNRIFYQKYKTGPMTATNYFHDFSKVTNYIKTERIKKDIKYLYQGKYASLDITINKSKPEKDPLDIISSNHDNSKYPMCPLCMENIGLYQTDNLAPRTNHRVVSLTLNHEVDKWGIQYSPYAYFNEHIIVLKKEHSPMYVNKRTFEELIDFLNKFPHYLIGSNAGLPIVGGSILSHHHFQGGRHDFPIEKARVLTTIKKNRMKVEVLDWPLSVVRIVGNNENKILDLVGQIFDFWINYSNESINIFSKTDTLHNAVTPIVKLDGANYNFYMIFRNNYTNKEFPYGMYHPDPSRFHIKKENIGLIETMGLAILPGRLEEEIEMIKKVLVNKESIDSYPELEKHRKWIKTMENKDLDNIDEFLKNEIGRIFEEVLEDCNVFKYGTNEDFINFVNKAIY